MKKIILIVLVLAVATPAMAQMRQQRGGKPRDNKRRTDGFYILLGVTQGPTFSDFFDYVNTTYQAEFNNTTDRLKNFGSGATFNLGYISRFHRNFAIDVGFSLYGLKSRGRIDNLNSAIPEARIYHEVEYQVGLFTGTLPILFEFAPRQRVVPYVGVGLSIFAMRLDDFRDFGTGISEATRDTRTAVGGHFEGGIDFKITPRIWLDLRGRWHSGSGHLATLENDMRDFKIKQNISQFTLGVEYFFR